MILFIPTPHGAGVRLWGTQDELHEFYETLEHFWNPLEEASSPLEYQRDNILACFCYDVRHGLMGIRTVAQPVQRRHLAIWHRLWRVLYTILTIIEKSCKT